MKTHTTDDPLLTQLAQIALHDQGLYEGVIDGVWGPKSELAFQIYGNYNRYAGIAKLEPKLSAAQQADMAVFLKNWKNPDSRAKYNSVATAADIPAELVAAIHYRECPDFPAFGTYLHNGDPMRNPDGDSIPTTHVPRGYIAVSWTTAAIDAITRETAARAQSGIESWTANLECMCVFAEYYNGEGYRSRGVPDPYVLAGTTGYAAGKFVADGSYDPEAVDAELGILVMLRAIVTPASPAA